MIRSRGRILFTGSGPDPSFNSSGPSGSPTGELVLLFVEARHRAVAPARSILYAAPVRSGVLLMILGSMSFTAMVGFVKSLRGDLSTVELIFWRGILAIVLLGLFARPPSFRIENRKLFAARLLLGFFAMSCFYGATKGLALTDLTLISKLQPILIALGAPVVLGSSERSGPDLWVILLVAFGGTALIVGPDLAVGSWYGLVALAGAIASAGAHLALRGLGGTESTRAVVFWFQGGLAVVALALMAATGAPPSVPDRSLWPRLVMVGVTATAGQLFMTRAYALDRAAVVAAAGYSSLLWALLGDVLFFDMRPGLTVLAGGALVVGAGLRLVRSSAGASPGPASPS